MYKYGMRARPFDIGCQPKRGFEDWLEDSSGEYYNFLVYNRKLEDGELLEYELDFIGKTELYVDFIEEVF